MCAWAVDGPPIGSITMNINHWLIHQTLYTLTVAFLDDVVLSVLSTCIGSCSCSSLSDWSLADGLVFLIRLGCWRMELSSSESAIRVRPRVGDDWESWLACSLAVAAVFLVLVVTMEGTSWKKGRKSVKLIHATGHLVILSKMCRYPPLSQWSTPLPTLSIYHYNEPCKWASVIWVVLFFWNQDAWQHSLSICKLSLIFIS